MKTNNTGTEKTLTLSNNEARVLRELVNATPMSNYVERAAEEVATMSNVEDIQKIIDDVLIAERLRSFILQVL